MCPWLIRGPLPALDSVSRVRGRELCSRKACASLGRRIGGRFPLITLLWAVGLLEGGTWRAAGPGVWSIPFPDPGFHLLFWGQEDAALYRHLGALLRHCLMISADGEDRTEEFHRSVL